MELGLLLSSTKIRITMLCVALVVFFGIVTLMLLDRSTQAEPQLLENSEEKVEPEENSLIEVEAEELAEVNPEEEFPMNMSELHVQNAIHHMSHQKVAAKAKWGSLEITPERISRLIEVVEANRHQYNHYNLYVNILQRWAEDDFSKAVQDHNAIWKIQGGTIGKATRLLTEEEEMNYIQSEFRQNR